MRTFIFLGIFLEFIISVPIDAIGGGCKKNCKIFINNEWFTAECWGGKCKKGIARGGPAIAVLQNNVAIVEFSGSVDNMGKAIGSGSLKYRTEYKLGRYGEYTITGNFQDGNFNGECELRTSSYYGAVVVMKIIYNNGTVKSGFCPMNAYDNGKYIGNSTLWYVSGLNADKSLHFFKDPEEARKWEEKQREIEEIERTRNASAIVTAGAITGAIIGVVTGAIENTVSSIARNSSSNISNSTYSSSNSSDECYTISKLERGYTDAFGKKYDDYYVITCISNNENIKLFIDDDGGDRPYFVTTGFDGRYNSSNRFETMEKAIKELTGSKYTRLKCGCE